MTVKEAAAKWNCSEEQVRSLCRTGQIDGAEKISGSWKIPDAAQSPLKDEHETQQVKPAEKKKEKDRSGLVMVLVMLGAVGICLLGGWLFTQDSLFLGGILVAVGAGILTFFTSSLLPNIKGEIQFAVIFIVAVLVSFLLFGTGSSSGGRSWSDLSDTEKANAKWAYEAQNYIDSGDYR